MKNVKKILRTGVCLLLVIFMMLSVSMMCYAQTTSDDATETPQKGILHVNISIGEDTIVKFHTCAETDDGSFLMVTFDGETYKISENKKGVFSFISVTPQNFNDVISAKMYNKDGNQLGGEKVFSVQSYLETLLGYTYGDEGCTCGCESKLQHTALQELVVNI